MTLELLRAFFGWCTILNWAVLAVWFVLLLVSGNLVYRLHGRLFGLDPTELRTVHYKCIVYYKVSVVLFNLAPYLALRIVA